MWHLYDYIKLAMGYLKKLQKLRHTFKFFA